MDDAECIEESIEQICVMSKRLCMILKYTQFKNVNLIEKTILYSLINEIAGNIKIETENTTNMLMCAK